jgi:hypothetical protein
MNYKKKTKTTPLVIHYVPDHRPVYFLTVTHSYAYVINIIVFLSRLQHDRCTATPIMTLLFTSIGNWLYIIPIYAYILRSRMSYGPKNAEPVCLLSRLGMLHDIRSQHMYRTNYNILLIDLFYVRRTMLWTITPVVLRWLQENICKSNMYVSNL